MKNTLLWSTKIDDMYGSKENFVKEHEDLILQSEGYKSVEEITDEDIYDYFTDCNNITYDKIIDDLVAHDGDTHDSGFFLVKTDCERRNHRHEGGIIMADLSEALEQVINFDLYQDGVKIQIIKNNLHITGYLHDGTDYFVIYHLTDKGQKWYENNEELYSDEALCDHLWHTKGYTRSMFRGKLGLDKWSGM